MHRTDPSMTDHSQRFVRIHSIVFSLTCLLLAMASTGCSTLLGRSKGPLDNIDTTSLKMHGYTVGPQGVMQPLPTGEESPSVVLEVNHGKRSFERVPLVPGQPMFIADLVRDAEFQKKIGRVQVKILRPNGSQAPIRLDVDFDDSGKRVMEGMNYSLRPGDHVVVSRTIAVS
jgi:hypothetical protein